MKVEIDADFSDAIARFDSLPEAVGEKLRWAAFKGVELLRDEVKIQAPRSHKRHYFTVRAAEMRMAARGVMPLSRGI